MKTNMRITFHGLICEFENVEIDKRPNINTEEIEQEDGTFVPGLATWQPLNVKNLPLHEDAKKLFDKFVDRWVNEDTTVDRAMVTLFLKDEKGENLETWYLANAWFDALNFNESSVDLTIRFNDVRYHAF